MADTVADGQASDGRPAHGRTRAEDLLAALALAAILALGFYLRWERLQWAEFDADQAWSLNRAFEFVRLGDFPLQGIPSSVGTAQGPAEIWLLALPVALGQDPRLATAFVGLLQMLAVLGTYFLAGRYFGRPVGLLAALLFACNPWAVYYARKIWTPALTPAFVVLLFACLYAAVCEHRRWLFAVACATLALLVLIHPGTAVYGPLLALVWLLYRRRLGWRAPLAGGGLALLVAAPYLYGQAQAGFAGVARFAGATTGGAPRLDLEALAYLLDLAGDGNLRLWLADRFLAGPTVPALPSLAPLAAALVLAGLALCAWRAWPRRVAPSAGREAHLLLLLWFVIPLALTLRHSLPLQEHYYIAVWPAQFILMALALAAAGQAGRRWLAGRARPWLANALPGALALALVASQLSASLAYVGAVADVPRQPYGAPLVYMQQAVDNLRAARSQAGAGPVFTCCSANQTLGLNYLARPELRLELLDPRSPLLPSNFGARSLFLVAHNDAYDPPLSFDTVADEGPLLVRLRQLGFVELPERAVTAPGRVLYRLFWLPPSLDGRVLPTYRQPPAPLALGDGRRLLSYRLPAVLTPGEPLPLSLLWHLPATPAGRPLAEENIFAHLVDHTGVVLANADWEAEPPPGGQLGEGYLLGDHGLRLPAGLGPGVYWLDLGAYNRYSRQPVGTTLKLGPLKIGVAATPVQPRQPTDHRFGDWLRLGGYDQTQSGQALDLTLHWQALAKPTAAYTVSVQLLDAAGRLVAQQDSPPRAGHYPTSYWEAGETVPDEHHLTLPAGLADGEYRLLVVVYTTEGGKRLPVAGSDAALLTTLRVAGGMVRS
ncbi:MAG: ArnT family glycosyltransferase [Chloroflexota bacterium]